MLSCCLMDHRLLQSTDFGATEYMTDKHHWFQTFSPVEDQCWSVKVADDFTLWVRGVGDVIVRAIVNGCITHVCLKDFLYVPQLRKNLISISKLTEQGVAIIHIRDTCKMISNNGDGHIIMIGKQDAGLWSLNITTESKQSSVNIANSSISLLLPVPEVNRADYTLRKWHHRLGHLNGHTLKKMARHEVIDGLIISPSADLGVCGGCAHGKQHRLPFPVNLERKRANHLGKFFHTDVSGPMQIKSQGGARYFVVFEDDYSSLPICFHYGQ